MGPLLNFLLGQVLLREVTKWRMWVFGRKLILPRFVGLVGSLADEVLELVLIWVRSGILWRLEAGLSRRRFCARDDCCSFGSICITSHK